MVMAVALLAYSALTGHASSMNSRIGRELIRQNTTTLFSEQLQQLFYAPKDSSLSISLENSSSNLLSLSFARWTSDAKSGGIRTGRLERVTFTYEPLDGEYQLMQKTEALTGPVSGLPSRTNWPGKTWPALQVHLHDGTSWRTNWSASASGAPSAAKIIMTGDDEKVATTESLILIPAGLSITTTNTPP